MELKAFLSGQVYPIEQADDPVFSAKILGDGIIIEPTSNVIVAPCDGVITATFPDSMHAVGISCENGMHIIIHEGIGTVSLQGKGFQMFVQKGDHVTAGDRLFSFDANILKEHGCSATCIFAVTNYSLFPTLTFYTDMEAEAGKTVFAEV